MKRIIGCTALVLFVIGIAAFGTMVLRIKRAMTPERLDGWDVVAPCIQSNSLLKSQWEAFQADTFEHEVLTAKATKGMLQLGAGFYVRCKYDPADLPSLVAKWGKAESTSGTWQEHLFSGTECAGVRYEFWINPSWDGPVSHAVIDSEHAGVVHYFGYAGDG